MTRSIGARLAAVASCLIAATAGGAGVTASRPALAAANAAPTGCPDNETCLLTVRVSDPTDPGCDYGCPSGDDITVTATGSRSNIPGSYVPPSDFIVIYEVPTSGANCVGVTGTDNGCIEVASCDEGQAVCTETLSWNWNASYPGATTTHVFEAWTINTSGNYPDYCSGKSWFEYSTSYIYPYLGDLQLNLASAGDVGAAGAGIAETAASVPLSTPVTVRTFAEDPPFFDSNFSTYQCPNDASAPPGVAACTTQPGSYTYPGDQAFGTSATSGYAGCNAATIPAPPGWTWPSPLTDNGPYQSDSPSTEYFISTQAVDITDPDSNNVSCMGLGPSQPQIGVSNWLALSWYCPPAVSALTAAAGSGQQAPAGTAFAAPLSALVVNSCTGQGLPGSAVTFTLPAGAATFAGGGTTETDVSGPTGLATTSTVSAGDVPQSFTVAADDSGDQATFSLTDVCNPTWGTSIVATSGTPQFALAGSPFRLPLTARVENQCGTPLAGASVTFSLPAARASFDSAPSSEVDVVTTGADGTASSVPVRSGVGLANLGGYQALATATFAGPFSPQGPAYYDLVNGCDPVVPVSISIAGGDGQQVAATQAFAPLSVTVVNQCGGAWTGGQVTFAGPAPGAAVPRVSFGSAGGPVVGTGTTGPQGLATSPVPWAGAVGGALAVTASVAATTVSPVTFRLTIVPALPRGPVVLPTADRVPVARRRVTVASGPPPGRVAQPSG